MKRAILFAKLNGKLIWFCLALLISAGILWWIVPNPSLAAIVGFDYYGTNYNPGNNLEITATGNKVSVVVPKKVKDALLGDTCTDWRDCPTVYGCQASSPADNKITYVTDCVNGQCVTTGSAYSEACQRDIPRCYNDNPKAPSDCGECNAADDCTKKEATCENGNVVSHPAVCQLHGCYYQNIPQTPACTGGCLVINGKAKCVACDNDSACTPKAAFCNPFANKITRYSTSCNLKRGVCETKVDPTLSYDCKKNEPINKFCIPATPPAYPEASCVQCRSNNNCSSQTPTKKCTADGKAFQVNSPLCQNYQCLENYGKAQSCPTNKRSCINGECFECQSNTDCGYKTPEIKCAKDLSGYNVFPLAKANCNDLNKCEFTPTFTACQNSSDNQPTYCKNGSPLPSCVQCLADSHCAYQGKSASCNGDVLTTYTPGCVANTCDKEAKKSAPQDCAKEGLSCLENLGRCGCSLDTQCEDQRPADAHKQPKCNDDGKSYTYFESRCNGANGFCAYDPIVTTCEGNAVCHDFADGARCINCASDSDCSALKKDGKYSPTCKNGQVTTYTTFTCVKPDPNDPEQNYCSALSKTNPCKKGFYNDSKGIGRCLDCTTNKDCSYPLASYCDAKNTKFGYNYKATGTCNKGTCTYSKITYPCLRNGFTNCLDDNTLGTYGKGYCKNTNGKLSCAQDVISTEPCLGCFYAQKNKLTCRK